MSLKRLHIVIITALALLTFSGCSQDDNFALQKEHTQTSEENVEVKLIVEGLPTVSAEVTRADADITAANSVGVFGLAKGQYSTTLTPFDWASPSSPYNISSPSSNDNVLMWNRAVNATGANGTVDFGDGNTYYYPGHNGKRYQFFAYYPHQSSGVARTSFDANVTFVMDGTVDICHGMSHSASKQYSSAFYHTFTPQSAKTAGYDYLPKIKLSHKLAKVRFEASTGNTITAVTVKDMPAKAVLTVADLYDNKYSGVISFSETLRDYVLTQETDGSFVAYLPCVDAYKGKITKITITVIINGETRSKTIDFTEEGYLNGLTPGTAYTIRLTPAGSGPTTPTVTLSETPADGQDAM